MRVPGEIGRQGLKGREEEAEEEEAEAEEEEEEEEGEGEEEKGGDDSSPSACLASFRFLFFSDALSMGLPRASFSLAKRIARFALRFRIESSRGEEEEEEEEEEVE